MMQTDLPRSWKEVFAIAAEAKREETEHQIKLARLEKQERERREEERVKEKRRQEEVGAMIVEALAPAEHVATFRTQLTTYDTHTVEALMVNQEAADITRRRIEQMIERAHVLPDGRRVFRTEDGERVFDERGLQVRADEIDPKAIDARRPTWEAFQEQVREGARLSEERRELFDYQRRLDEARERLDRGDITERDLERLSTGLTDGMPEAVRRRLEQRQPVDAAAPTPSAAPQALPADMDALMRQTGLGARGIAP